MRIGLRLAPSGQEWLEQWCLAYTGGPPVGSGGFCFAAGSDGAEFPAFRVLEYGGGGRDILKSC